MSLSKGLRARKSTGRFKSSQLRALKATTRRSASSTKMPWLMLPRMTLSSTSPSGAKVLGRNSAASAKGWIGVGTGAVGRGISVQFGRVAMGCAKGAMWRPVRSHPPVM